MTLVNSKNFVQLHARPRLQRAATFSAVLLIVPLLLTACGGSGDDDDRTEGGRVVMATFTPVPPNWTPEADPTIEAARTQVAEMQTATASAPTPTAGPTQPVEPPTGNEDVIFPTPPGGAGAVYPPTSVLVTTAGRYIEATVGSYNWFEQSTQGGGSFNAPWIELTDASVVAVAGDVAILRFDAEAPEPETTKIEVYTVEGNTAIPTTVDGQSTDKPAFLRQADPVLSTTSEEVSPSFSLDVAPGNYFVLATVTWPMVPGVEEYGDQMTQYLYRVTVQ